MALCDIPQNGASEIAAPYGNFSIKRCREWRFATFRKTVRRKSPHPTVIFQLSVVGNGALRHSAKTLRRKPPHPTIIFQLNVVGNGASRHSAKTLRRKPPHPTIIFELSVVGNGILDCPKRGSSPSFLMHNKKRTCKMQMRFCYGDREGAKSASRFPACPPKLCELRYRTAQQKAKKLAAGNFF